MDAFTSSSEVEIITPKQSQSVSVALFDHTGRGREGRDLDRGSESDSENTSLSEEERERGTGNKGVEEIIIISSPDKLSCYIPPQAKSQSRVGGSSMGVSSDIGDGETISEIIQRGITQDQAGASTSTRVGESEKRVNLKVGTGKENKEQEKERDRETKRRKLNEARYAYQYQTEPETVNVYQPDNDIESDQVSSPVRVQTAFQAQAAPPIPTHSQEKLTKSKNDPIQSKSKEKEKSKSQAKAKASKPNQSDLKTSKQLAKERSRQLVLLNRLQKPAEVIKEMTVWFSDPNMNTDMGNRDNEEWDEVRRSVCEQLDEGGVGYQDGTTKLRRMSLASASTSFLDCLGLPSIRYTRLCLKRYDHSLKMFVPIPEPGIRVEEDVGVVWISASTVFNLIKEDTFWTFTNNLRNPSPAQGGGKEWIVMIYRLGAFMAQNKKAKRKQEMVEMEIIRAENKGVRFVRAESIQEASAWVYNLTMSVARRPYILLAKSHISVLSTRDQNAPTGQGQKDTFLKMLECIPGVTPSVARSIGEEYGSMRGLYEGWDTCSKECSSRAPAKEEIKKKKRDMLVGLSRGINTDGTVSGDRIGKAVSRRVYEVFNEKNGGRVVL